MFEDINFYSRLEQATDSPKQRVLVDEVRTLLAKSLIGPRRKTIYTTGNRFKKLVKEAHGEIKEGWAVSVGLGTDYHMTKD